jgi:hypothetical protein
MFLVPLNYDRFFKKAFSDEEIAKAFLEDFFQQKIIHLEVLPETKRVTDYAQVVKVDYHCIMDNNNHVIIVHDAAMV